MPKVVDHQERRADIVDALWRVVRRDGIAATSVRTVADEAGLSAGALRHYFTTQSELLAVAVRSMADGVGVRVERRMGAWQAEPGALGSEERLDRLVGVLEEVVPLGARRRAEFEVWLEMVMLARTSPDLQELAVEAHRGLRRVCGYVVAAVSQAPPYPARLHRDPLVRRRTDELHALVDGLSLHLALYPREHLALDIGVPAEGSGFCGLAIAHNTRSREEVEATLEEAEAAGGRIIRPAAEAFWGGYSGYFADPDGFRWEIAWNPDFALDAGGGVSLPG